jgi:hypothetical protein
MGHLCHCTDAPEGNHYKDESGSILGQQLAVQADRFLEILDKSCYLVTGSQIITKIKK